MRRPHPPLHRSLHRTLVVALALGACTGGDAPSSRAPTPRGEGPRILFEGPSMPLPNDVATFADPTSRTGLRIEPPVEGTSALARDTRRAMAELEGWGTSAPITMRFDRPTDLAAGDAAIDLEVFAARHRGYDLRDDAVYVVDLRTGVPALVDVEHGHFPIAAVTPSILGPNDPRGREETLLFESVDEAQGLPRGAYRASLDTDFDGVLDVPNRKPPGLVAIEDRQGLDDILTWYERETDSLVLRPTIPLAEKREYAVVVTDRLVDARGRPARSPFAQVFHPLQAPAMDRLDAILSDARLVRFFGDIAGTGLSRVAFAWSFTTGPQGEDLRLLRDGLEGQGRFAWLARAFPPNLDIPPAVGAAPSGPSPSEVAPSCAGLLDRPVLVRADRFGEVIRGLLADAYGLSGAEIDAALRSFAFIDHFVVGSFTTPRLLAAPDAASSRTRFRVNFAEGTAVAAPERVKFWIAVPKANVTARQPFPVALWSHGAGRSAEEIFLQAGAMAQQGVALAAIDMPGHGLALDAGARARVGARLADACLAPLGRAFAQTRALDGDGDGTKDPGADTWSEDLFHTRDVLRQGVVDSLQFLRVLRGFDGRIASPVPTVGGAASTLLGDFDGDGVVDVQGPLAPHAVVGPAFGAIVSQLVGAIDPRVKAVVPIGGAGGLSDLLARGAGFARPALGKLFSPFVLTVPARDRADATGDGATKCTATQRSLRIVAANGAVVREAEVACLGDDRAPAQANFLLRNATSGEVRCAKSDREGRVRIPLAASEGDALSVGVYAEPDALLSYATCTPRAGATKLAAIETWEVPAVSLVAKGGVAPSCAAADGCQQFGERLFGVGSRLVAPREGFGFRRQSPSLRRFLGLAQHALDQADPVNYTTSYVLRGVPGPDGRPMAKRALLNVALLGDGEMLTASSSSFARAAGVIPFVPSADATRVPELLSWSVPTTLKAIWSKTPDAILVDRHVVEGLGRLARTPASAACGVNYASSRTCTAAPPRDDEVCRETLYDPDFIDEGLAQYGQQTPNLPLRLARVIDEDVIGSEGLARAYAPRSQSKPRTTDAEGWPGSVPLAAHLGFLASPTGAGRSGTADACKAFDEGLYLQNLVARFVATGGTDVHYLARPGSHPCLARGTCDFLPR